MRFRVAAIGHTSIPSVRVGQVVLVNKRGDHAVHKTSTSAGTRGRLQCTTRTSRGNGSDQKRNKLLGVTKISAIFLAAAVSRKIAGRSVAKAPPQPAARGGVLKPSAYALRERRKAPVEIPS